MKINPGSGRGFLLPVTATRLPVSMSLALSHKAARLKMFTSPLATARLKMPTSPLATARLKKPRLID